MGIGAINCKKASLATLIPKVTTYTTITYKTNIPTAIAVHPSNIVTYPLSSPVLTFKHLPANAKLPSSNIEFLNSLS